MLADCLASGPLFPNLFEGRCVAVAPHVQRFEEFENGDYKEVSTPRIVKVRPFSIPLIAPQTLCWPRFHDERTSVHLLKMSIIVRLQRKLPLMSPPQ